MAKKLLNREVACGFLQLLNTERNATARLQEDSSSDPVAEAWFSGRFRSLFGLCFSKNITHWIHDRPS